MFFTHLIVLLPLSLRGEQQLYTYLGIKVKLEKALIVPVMVVVAYHRLVLRLVRLKRPMLPLPQCIPTIYLIYSTKKKSYRNVTTFTVKDIKLLIWCECFEARGMT